MELVGSHHVLVFKLVFILIMENSDMPRSKETSAMVPRLPSSPPAKINILLVSFQMMLILKRLLIQNQRVNKQLH